MTNSVEKTAKTVEDAINIALSELNASEEDVDIEIIDKGVKGIFGLIGSKQARVRVTIKESMADKAKEFLMEVFQKMDVDADVLTQEDKESVTIKITGDNIGILIGRRGETLDSLQYLTSLVVNKNKQNYKRVIIDIENYRQKRKETLIKLANKLAERVVKYKKSITLEPMNPYERRIIHSALQNNKTVSTYSEGTDPYRRLVIEYIK